MPANNCLGDIKADFLQILREVRSPLGTQTGIIYQPAWRMIHAAYTAVPMSSSWRSAMPKRILYDPTDKVMNSFVPACGSMFALKMPAITAGFVLRTSFTFSCYAEVGNDKASPNSISSCHSIALTKPFLSQQHSLIYLQKSNLNSFFSENIC